MIHIVGIGDIKTSDDPRDVIVTFALGSCLGISIYDPEAKVGGLLHVMLPTSAICPGKAGKNPFMFVDTGVPRFFQECYGLGAKKERLVIKVAGGASINSNGMKVDHFQIGEKNFTTLRELLWENNLLLKAYDVGGEKSRNMSFEMATGNVTVKINDNLKII